jgi:biopolymer transport protein ExbD
MDKRVVELESVRQRIEQARNESPESTVVIIADQRSETGILIDLMDQVRLGGILNISVAAETGGQ